MKTGVLALLAAALGQSPAATAQNDSTALVSPPSASRPVPFAAGERMQYLAKIGPTHVGRGSMEIVGIEDVRGRPAVHTRFMLRGGWLWFRANYLLESWVDQATFSSVRFSQDSDDDPSERDRIYEIFPERRTYRVNDGDERPSVEAPLDEGALLYYVRTMPLEVGKTYTLNRYFRPDRNPVVVKVVRRETIKVPAGTFQTIVIQPIIKSRGIFSEGGQAQIWLSDDSSRVMVQMRVRLKVANISLQLLSHHPGQTPTP
ncbi:MAG: DUF3108 domain-containing protein [Gemmatimonadaceae bacterium]|nr:DUF3108 domain-containing protein [Gemmatimonadaceae bacterium]